MSRATTASLASSLAAVLLALPGCGRPPAAHTSPRLVERSQMAMGTEVRISVWTDDEPRAVDACAQAFEEFDRLERLMSVWIAGSDIQRLNEGAGGSPVPVSAEVLEVLQIAQQISEWSGGVFDVTFAALSGLWKFDTQDKDGSVPDPDAIRARLPLVNYRDLVVDPRARTARLKRSG